VIDEFKRVYTGWYIDEITCPAPNAARLLLGLRLADVVRPGPARHDAKILFAGLRAEPDRCCPPIRAANQDLNAAIDAIFEHPNVGPYLSRELIKSLVTSNPTPAYVERVSSFFDDNGAGVRGSLWAVVKAILLDPEARQAPDRPGLREAA
jgi:uncharacterized protein (DUF1800 family)